MSEQVLPNSPKPLRSREILDTIIAGRDATKMRHDIANALFEINPSEPVEEIERQLEQIKISQSLRGEKARKIEDAYAIIEAAISLYRRSTEDPKRFPRVSELATSVRMADTDVTELLLPDKKISRALRERFIAPYDRRAPKQAGRVVPKRK